MRLIYVVVVLTVFLVSLLYISFNPLPGPNFTSIPAGVTCHLYGTSFAVLANGLGFNDSVDHDNYWPVMCVHRGNNVTITVENTGSSEPHGFAIAHYYSQGVSIPAGTKVTVKFTADQAGAYSVSCSIYCSVHAFMQSGLLVVS